MARTRLDSMRVKNLWKADVWKTSPDEAVKASMDGKGTAYLDGAKLYELASKSQTEHPTSSMSLYSKGQDEKAFADLDKVPVRVDAKRKTAFEYDVPDNAFLTTASPADAVTLAYPDEKVDHQWMIKENGHVSLHGRDIIQNGNVLDSHEWERDKRGIDHETATSLEDQRYQKPFVDVKVPVSWIHGGEHSDKDSVAMPFPPAKSGWAEIPGIPREAIEMNEKTAVVHFDSPSDPVKLTYKDSKGEQRWETWKTADIEQQFNRSKGRYYSSAKPAPDLGTEISSPEAQADSPDFH